MNVEENIKKFEIFKEKYKSYNFRRGEINEDVSNEEMIDYIKNLLYPYCTDEYALSKDVLVDRRKIDAYSILQEKNYVMLDAYRIFDELCYDNYLSLRDSVVISYNKESKDINLWAFKYFTNFECIKNKNKKDKEKAYGKIKEIYNSIADRETVGLIKEDMINMFKEFIGINKFFISYSVYEPFIFSPREYNVSRLEYLITLIKLNNCSFSENNNSNLLVSYNSYDTSDLRNKKNKKIEFNSLKKFYEFLMSFDLKNEYDLLKGCYKNELNKMIKMKRNILMMKSILNLQI